MEIHYLEPILAPFFVSGIPRAQPRGMATRRGRNRAGIVNPGNADMWKAKLALELRFARPVHPLSGPLLLDCCFVLPRPKRLLQKRDPDGPLWCDEKPDRDNLDKAVLDAMKDDGWFVDDCVLCSGSVSKVFHRRGGIPGLWLRLSRIEFPPEDLISWAGI